MANLKYKVQIETKKICRNSIINQLSIGYQFLNVGTAVIWIINFSRLTSKTDHFINLRAYFFKLFGAYYISLATRLIFLTVIYA